MPYFIDQNLEDENENPGQIRISGASPTSESMGSTTAQGGGEKKLNTGSGFQNLDKYLQTNESQAFGNQVLGKVKDQVQDASQKMNEASDQFKQQVNTSNRLPSQEQVSQAIADPTNADQGQFQDWMKQRYEGPKSLSESQDAWNKYWSGTNQANTSAKNLGSEAGRFSLLDQYFGRPQYGFGEKSLDNLLVQQSGLGNQTRNLQNQAASLKSQGQQQARELQGIAAQRAGAVDQSRNAVLNAIGLDEQGNVKTGAGAGAIGSQYQAVYDKMGEQNAARTQELTNLRNAISSSQLTDAQLASLGLARDQNIYNLDLNKYVTPGAELNRNQVMSPEQRARIQALSQLAGIEDTFASGAPEAINPAYTFNRSAFDADVASAQQGIQSEIAAAQAAEEARIQDFMRRNPNTTITGTPKVSQQVIDEIMRKYGSDRTAGQIYARDPARTIPSRRVIG